MALSALLVVAALLPLILILALIAFVRWPASKSLLLVWVVTALIGYSVWSMPGDVIGAASGKGFFVALEQLLLLFGAVFLAKVLEKAGVMVGLKSVMDSISSDRRVQAVLVAWLISALFESAAGFNFPTLLAATFLVGIGFPAAAAVAVCLIANSTAVSFGALGKPIVGALAQIVSADSLSMLSGVTVTTAVIHAAIGTFVPFLLVMVLTRWYGGSWKAGLEMFPFCVWSGLAFTVPYAIAARYAGPVWPSLIGSLIGLVLVIFSTRAGWFLPKKSWDFFAGDDKKSSAKSMKSSKQSKSVNAITLKSASKKQGMSGWMSVLPYLLVALLVALSRFTQVGAFLSKVSIVWSSGGEVSWLPFFSPGFLMLIVAIGCLFIYRCGWKGLKFSVGIASRRTAKAFFALVFISAALEIIIASRVNLVSLPGMVDVIALAFQGLSTGLVFVSPFLGVIGSLIGGSATMSNLLFGPLQLTLSQISGVSAALLLSLQNIGASVGKMIAVQNIVLACAAVGAFGEEGRVLQMTFLPAIIYVILAGLIALLFFL